MRKTQGDTPSLWGHTYTTALVGLRGLTGVGTAPVAVHRACPGTAGLLGPILSALSAAASTFGLKKP